MCKRKQHTSVEPYDGPTVHLGDGTAAMNQGSSHRCMHSPWHLLWLLWPLSFLVKWAIPTLASTWIAVVAYATSWSFTPQTLLATIFIGCGLFLIMRRTREDDRPYD